MLRPESSSLAASSAVRSTGRIIFGGGPAGIVRRDSSPSLGIALPVLAGAAHEELLLTEGDVDTRQGCVVFDSARETAGFVVASPNAGLETAARKLYRQIFAATAGRRLYRIWNYVPQINAVQQGLENYRQFCRGRSLAFEDQFGLGYQSRLPAASAVGTRHGPLAIAFLAGEAEPRHFENPRQVPAFEYPAIYGPRAPSFSRATLVDGGAGRQLFVSGTAAIRGHATIAADDLAGQLACTRENLEVIAQTSGAGGNFGADDGWRRTFKIYLRHAADLDHVRADLERHLLEAGDVTTYLEADLCRSDLRVEIEAVLSQSQ